MPVNNLLPVDIATGDLIRLARTNPLHYTSAGQLGGAEAERRPSFEDALLRAMDGVNAHQTENTNLVQRMLVDPDAVDAHDVTLAMSRASMSLNIARTVLDRVVRAWRDLINTR
ncbi:MAG TPA: flagellar hook-basal body complex protein FliE [Magnetospirillaceae bacterium]|nr:flagellar hook-basal body complex protein FliE [Magnetospirillaceae bacterium]